MNVQSMLKNWKTTTMGVASILAGTPLIIAAIKARSTDPVAYTPGVTAIVTGLGLLFAGDGDKSASKDDHAALQQQINDTQKAVVSGDTTIITRVQAENQPKP